MKIALANPVESNNRQGNVVGYPNMGLLSLISYIREKMKDEVRIEYIETMPFDRHLRLIEKINPDIYGISFASHTLTYSKNPYVLINEIKGRFPSMPVICGGTHPTAMPEDVLAKSRADIVCIGEGEETFREIISYFQGKIRSLSEINGIAYRGENGEFIRTAKRKFCDIDSLPMPAWDIIDLNNYSGPHLRKTGGYATCVLSSRGCPFNCVYCSNPIWRTDKPWFRMKDPKLVVEEIGYLYDRGVREIYIRADELNPNVRWCLKLCDEIAKAGWKDLYFQCNLRVDAINEELVAALSGINCWLVYLGIESMNQRVIDGIDKRFDVERVPEVCRLLKKHGIQVFGYMMLYQVWEENNELRWETPEEVDNTISAIWRFSRKDLLDYISWQFATPMPGARLWDIAVRHNLMKDKMKGVWDINMRIPGVSERRMVRQRLRGFLMQGYFAARKGHINWRMWKRILRKVSYVARSLR